MRPLKASNLRKFFIYALIDPRFSDSERRTRYVGVSFDDYHRVHDHIYEAEHGSCSWRVYRWLRTVLRSGYRPDFVILFEGLQGLDDWSETERFFIYFYRHEVGCDLTNMSDGGNGNIGWKMSPETKMKLSLANKGRKRTPEQVAKMCERNRSPEMRQLMSDKMKDKKKSPEHREKIREFMTGRHCSEETRRKMSNSHRGI